MVLARIEIKEVPKFNVKEYANITDYQGYEAEDISNLYCKTYNIKPCDILTQVSYPYPESLDPEWIHETAQDKDVIWKVVTDTLANRVIGSGTVLLNRANQRAYVRGVMIDPDYQGFGLGGYILVNAFKEIINNHRDAVKIFWTESRTAHNKSQKIADPIPWPPHHSS